MMIANRLGEKDENQHVEKLKERVREKFRQRLALLKTEAEYPEQKTTLQFPKSFRKSFEDQELFGGWTNYRVTWDVDEKDPWKIRSRK